MVIDRVMGARLVVSFGGDAASSGMRVHQAVWAGTPGTGRVPGGVEADKRLRKGSVCRTRKVIETGGDGGLFVLDAMQ